MGIKDRIRIRIANMARTKYGKDGPRFRLSLEAAGAEVEAR